MNNIVSYNGSELSDRESSLSECGASKDASMNLSAPKHSQELPWSSSAIIKLAHKSLNDRGGKAIGLLKWLSHGP